MQECDLRFFSVLAVCVLCLTGAASAATHPEAKIPSLSTRYGVYLSARIASAHHDLAAAAAMYGASVERDPANVQLLTSAFFYSAAAGKIDDSAEYARRLVSVGPDARAAHLTLAVVALKHRDYATARKEILTSARGDSSYTVTLLGVWAAAGLGEREAAAAGFKAMHAQEGADALASFNEALMADYQNDPVTADAAYRKTLQALGPSPRLVDAYGRFLERNGRAQDAAVLYSGVQEGSAFQPVTAAGLARIAKGEKPEPLISSVEDGAAEALFGVAASLTDNANADVSILYLRLALYLHPDFDLAEMLLADRLDAIDRSDEAVAVYDGIARGSAYFRLAAIQKASVASRNNNFAAALKDMQALSAQYPDDIDVWAGLGDIQRQAKDFSGAVKSYSRAIALSGPPVKKRWPLYYARAVSAQGANDWATAESDLELSLKLNPDEPQILNFLGYSWVDQHRNLDDALRMLEKAAKLSPDDGYITDSVGWAYYRLGRYRDAAERLELAVMLVPEDPTINDHLGDAYWRVGRKLDAEFQWNHALAFGAADEEKATIEKKLASGLDK
jgi:tetratricopeptide (TPR) repeat protein